MGMYLRLFFYKFSGEPTRKKCKENRLFASANRFCGIFLAKHHSTKKSNLRRKKKSCELESNRDRKKRNANEFLSEYTAAKINFR